MNTDQFITPAATLAGVILGFGLNVIRDILIERKKIGTARKQLASSLLSEATVLHNRLEAVFGKSIQEWEEDEELSFGGGARATNLFVVFDQNADKLGFFSEEDVNIIVRAYILTKTLVESVNNVSEMKDQHNRQVGTYLASNRQDAVNLERESLGDIQTGWSPYCKRNGKMLFILPSMLKGFWRSTLLADYSNVRDLWSFPAFRYLKLNTLTFFQAAESSLS